jgi:DNA processing protein
VAVASGRTAGPDAAERGGEAWARAAWSIVAEPGDATAGAVVAALGAPAALAWALWAVTVTPAVALRRLRDLARARDHRGPAGATRPGTGRCGGQRSGAPTGGAEVGASGRERWVGAPISTGTALGDGQEPGGAHRAGHRAGTDAGAFEQGTLLGSCVGAPGRADGCGGGACGVPGAGGDAVRGLSGGAGGDACGGAGGGVGGGAGGDAARGVPCDAGGEAAGAAPPDPWPEGTLRVLARALPRWAPRLADLDPRAALDDLDARGGVLLVPGTPAWPRGLDDLGPSAPLCLWLRGDPDLAGAAVRSVAVVGARAATAYGERVAGDLGAGLAERGVTVVSGGAFGIDVAAHRGALAVGGRTVALLAGGIDRPSPAGNLAVLERIVDDGGALVAESPPGTPPSRARFLQRNRVIAALTGATVVVEAAWRSGALSTAARAGELLRPVGAVPGPVTSMASVGCHRLLRDGAAVCVTDAAQVVELLDPAGSDGPGAADTVVRPGGADPAARPGGADPAVRDRRPDLAGRRGAAEPSRTDLAGRPGAAGPCRTDPAGRRGAAEPSRPDLADRRGAAGRAALRDGSVPAGRADRADPAGRRGAAGAARRPVPGVADRADSPAARVLDALDRRRTRTAAEVARRSGLGEQEAVAALGLLELAGEACRVEGRWRRTGDPRGGAASG